MAKTRKWHVLLCALLIIVAVITLMFVATSCKKKPGTTTDDSTQAVPGGSYDRTDTSGTKVDALVSGGVVGDMSEYTSVNGVVVLGNSIYVSDETGKSIYKLSMSGSVEKTYTSENTVNKVATDGENIYSLEGGLAGTVVKLSPELEKLGSAQAQHTPNDMAVYNGVGYVPNRFSGTVSVIKLSDMSVVKTISVDGREPAAVVTVGNNIYVACHLPDEASTEDVMSANVCIISAQTNEITRTLELVNGSSGVKDICVAPDGKTVYVAHVIGRYAFPTTQLDRAWINSNGFSIIDTETQSVKCALLLDEVDYGAANPWGITVTSDGKYLCTAISGLNQVMVVNISRMNTLISNVEKGRGLVDSLDQIVDYLPFLNGARERIEVGVGVREIFESDGKLYCGLYFDGAIDVIDLGSNDVTRLSFTEQPEASDVRLGQIYWSDANNCYQKWQSCNSCHPDAIVDGFNWDNLNDGLGNSKSAKSMLYAHRTPPVMVTGIRANAEIAVAAGMKFIQFNTLSSEDLAYIDEYLKTLYPIESPALNRDGTLSAEAADGEALFEANCASCHPAPFYTDMKMHDVGSAKLDREDGKYDTPTLLEVWRTGPYMHDGSLYTIEEVVRFFTDDKLTDAQVTALSEYVKSICGKDELYGVEQVRASLNDEESYNIYVDGASVSTITVRNQSEKSPASVVVAFNVYDSNGKQVYYCDAVVSSVAFNSTAVITLKPADGKEVVLPEGGSYAVTIYDNSTGKPISSTLTIN